MRTFGYLVAVEIGDKDNPVVVKHRILESIKTLEGAFASGAYATEDFTIGELDVECMGELDIYPEPGGVDSHV